MKVKFMTVKGSDGIRSRAPFYIGVPQHERIMSKKEAYAYCSEKTGYTQTAVRAVFQAMARYVRENAAKGNVTYIDGIASVRHYVKGSFDDLKGPWTKGRNLIMVRAVGMEPFKDALWENCGDPNENAVNRWKNGPFVGVCPQCLTGEGERAWSVTRNGTYVLTHTTFTNGVAGKAETVTFVVEGLVEPFADEDVTVSGYSGKNRKM